MTDPSTTDESRTDQRSHVRAAYDDVATNDGGCCGPTTAASTTDHAIEIGYERDDLETAPEDANMGLGCGNPVAISELEAGETVLDLGSGGGFDCFLAAREVGPDGQVIGVDMTPSMIDRARENARESEFETVEFRLGEIEHLPIGDERVDVIISNCVLNLSPEKSRVLEEAFRVLRPGGRLSISDLVATEPLPAAVREDIAAVTECVGNAATVDDLEGWLAGAGFVDIEIIEEGTWSEDYPIVSARIEAKKPV